jgi:hypothetical protein
LEIFTKINFKKKYDQHQFEINRIYFCNKCLSKFEIISFKNNKNDIKFVKIINFITILDISNFFVSDLYLIYLELDIDVLFTVKGIDKNIKIISMSNIQIFGKNISKKIEENKFLNLF